MPKISRCNDYGQVFLLFAALVLMKNSMLDSLNVLLALVLGLIFGEGLIKYLVKRERPVAAEVGYKFLIKLPNSFSFPSGHTTSSFAVLGVSWYLNLQYRHLILVLAVLIAFSRIYLHVHYPSDIIGGMVLGVLCAIITIKISVHINLVKLWVTNTISELYTIVHLSELFIRASELRLITHKFFMNLVL